MENPNLPAAQVKLNLASLGSEAGDDVLREEFELHFAESRAEITAYLLRRMGGKLGRRLDVQDLIQETGMAAFQQYATFRSRAAFPVRIWLLKTAQQKLIDAYRQHIHSAKRTLDREADWVDCSSVAIADSLMIAASSPSRQLHVEELKAKLELALAELSTTDREILLMRHFEGRAYSDIAMLIDMEENTVRQRFGRTLLSLRKITKRLGLLDYLA